MSSCWARRLGPLLSWRIQNGGLARKGVTCALSREVKVTHYRAETVPTEAWEMATGVSPTGILTKHAKTATIPRNGFLCHNTEDRQGCTGHSFLELTGRPGLRTPGAQCSRTICAIRWSGLAQGPCAAAVASAHSQPLGSCPNLKLVLGRGRYRKSLYSFTFWTLWFPAPTFRCAKIRFSQ